jgi:AcrR family transcriptional regulator
MSRKKVLEGGKKDEIINAALKLFMEKGYEETSVRMILDDANAVVGSFYHYFKSKEELFEEAIKQYMKKYETYIEAIAYDDTKPCIELFDLMLDEAEKGIQDYYFGNLQGNKLHWTIQYEIHRISLQALLPSIQKIIEIAIEEGTDKNILNVDISVLTAIVLNGVEGILHARPLQDLRPYEIKKMREDTIAYFKYILNITS